MGQFWSKVGEGIGDYYSFINNNQGLHNPEKSIKRRASVKRKIETNKSSHHKKIFKRQLLFGNKIEDKTVTTSIKQGRKTPTSKSIEARKTKNWTLKEIKSLKQAYVQYGYNNWEKILPKVPNKTLNQCRHKVRLLQKNHELSPVGKSMAGKHKKCWTEKEFGSLQSAITKLGYTKDTQVSIVDWIQVSKLVKIATAEQCYRKWQYELVRQRKV